MSDSAEVKLAKPEEEQKDPPSPAVAATEKPAKEKETATKTPRDPAASKEDDDDDDTKEPPAKRSRGEEETKENEEEEAPTEVVDLAVQLGIKDGDRLEVEWEIVETDENGRENMVTRWWGCQLQPWDGKVEDSVAVRILKYDAYPQGGFPEPTGEPVIFLSHEIIVSADGSLAEFRFRLEGVVQFNNEEETREAVNTILMDAMKKHSGTWSALTPAQQRNIADGIAQKKEQLIEAIQNYDKSPVIGAEDMKEILSGLMR